MRRTLSLSLAALCLAPLSANEVTGADQVAP